MKKVIAIVLALVLVLSLSIALTACGKESEKKFSYNIVANADYADMKIGVLHIGDPADGSGYSYAHDQGIVGMQVALGITDSQIVRKLNISDEDTAAIGAAIDDCIAQGCKIIFGTSYGYMDTMQAKATDNPTVLFAHGTGYKQNETNFVNYFGRIYQARYLAGIAAGLKTSSGKIGYVAAYGTTLAETCSGINAFALGAQSVNPTAKVYVKVLNSWYDPANETAYAEDLIRLGCDVITQHCDTANPQIAAENANKYGCGYNSDMSDEAPAAHLTAAIWNWETYYTSAVMLANEGQTAFMAAGNYYGGLMEGMVDVSPCTFNCAAGTKSAINQAKALMIAWQQGDTTNGFDVFGGYKLNITINSAGVATIEKVAAELGYLVKDHEYGEPDCFIASGDAYCGDGVVKGSMNQFVAGVELK